MQNGLIRGMEEKVDSLGGENGLLSTHMDIVPFLIQVRHI